MELPRMVAAGRVVDVVLPLPLSRRFSYLLPDDAPIGPGAVVRVPFGSRHYFGVVCERHDRLPQGVRMRAVSDVLPEPYRLPAELFELCRWVAEYYACSEGEALALALPPRPGTALRTPARESAETERGHELNSDQLLAVDRVAKELAAGEGGAHLLFGVTGSGKTEVYLELIELALAAGRTALVLLPEIALTPQTLGRIDARFRGRVAAYHSRLSDGERCDVWERAVRGEVPIVVGARSAVFLPLRNLGLIVVDEEHESSYKSDQRPRYHARDVALVRAQRARIPIVLGSATPSLESWANAQSGKSQLLRLSERASTTAMPRVEVVDRRGAVDLDKSGALGEELVFALEETLAAGEQAIIFHNRRGFARFVQCHACGAVRRCANCDISLIYHVADDRLHCHYCNARLPMPSSCEACQSPMLRPRGVGTQRVEVALAARLPNARILRLDQDSTRKKHAHEDILSAFGRGDADILVGTQMVAKGLDFPRVRLVGVVDADAGLNFPDFRAHERAFQLLTQVAGRSGRREPGRVILQSFDPQHRVLRCVQEHDVESFLAAELLERQMLGYPPARRLAALSITAADEALLERACQALDRRVRHLFEAGGIQLLGPARAAIGRIRRRFRGQLLLKGGLGAQAKRDLTDVCAELRRELTGGRRLDFALDVDPVHLL
jgi:primosomal protein N' (replication factor Y)